MQDLTGRQQVPGNILRIWDHGQTCRSSDIWVLPTPYQESGRCLRCPSPSCQRLQTSPLWLASQPSDCTPGPPLITTSQLCTSRQACTGQRSPGCDLVIQKMAKHTDTRAQKGICYGSEALGSHCWSPFCPLHTAWGMPLLERSCIVAASCLLDAHLQDVSCGWEAEVTTHLLMESRL